MKLSNFLVGTLVCAMAAACTNDTYESGNENNQTGNGEQAFIAVRLMAPNAMTKAFQDGEATENKVTTARFYFLDDSNAAVIVENGNSYINKTYTDDNNPFINATTPADEEGNVEEVSKEAILVLENNSTRPTKMVVVLNPPTSLSGNKSLSDLQGALDCSSTNGFVMSNSVYNDGNGTVDAVSISEYISETREGAQNRPVNVYVERVLARVDVKNNNNSLKDYDDDTEVKASDIIGQSTPSTDQVTAVVKGWGIANKNSTSYLLKKIGTTTTDPFNWNDVNNHRSYWAITTNLNSSRAANPAYDDMLVGADATFPTTQYCQERTGISTTDDNPTELVVVAELQVDNNPVTIARYAGQYYLPDDLMTVLLAQAGTIYIKSQESYSGTDKIENWMALSTAHVKLRPAETGEDNVAAYEAVFDLKDKYANSTNFQFASDSEGTNTMELTAVEGKLNALKAQLWYEGRTYYHVPITHDTDGSTTNTDPGRYGVVRNHLYNITVSGITGLGTPIPGDTNGSEDDPDDSEDPGKDPIDPENPEDNNSYLAAQINILSWNVISQDVTLGDNN